MSVAWARVDVHVSCSGTRQGDGAYRVFARLAAAESGGRGRVRKDQEHGQEGVCIPGFAIVLQYGLLHVSRYCCLFYHARDVVFVCAHNSLTSCCYGTVVV